GVGVITDPHASRFHFVGEFIKELGFSQPVLLRSRRHGGHDEELIADGLVELDRFFEFVAQDRLVRCVRAAGNDAIVIEHLSQFLGGAAMVTSELDAFVTDFRYRGEHPRQVGLTLISQGIQFEADGYFSALSRVTELGEGDSYSCADSSDSAQKLATAY